MLRYKNAIGRGRWNISTRVGWLVVLRIYVALAVFQPYLDLEARDNQSLKFKWRGGESNPGPLAPQAKSLTTRPPPLPIYPGTDTVVCDVEIEIVAFVINGSVKLTVPPD